MSPETWGQPPAPPPFDAERWARVKNIMKEVRVSGLHLNEAGAEEVATNHRYVYFAKHVSPMQWSIAASVIRADEDDRGRSERTNLNIIVNRLLADGPERQLVRARPGLSVAQWKSDVYESYLAALGTDEQPEPSDYEPQPRKPTYRIPIEPYSVAYEAEIQPERNERAEVAPERRSKDDSDGIDHSEDAARKWSRGMGLPSHRKGRKSQTVGGRHGRYVRQEAGKRGISPEAMDKLITRHPATCPYQS